MDYWKKKSPGESPSNTSTENSVSVVAGPSSSNRSAGEGGSTTDAASSHGDSFPAGPSMFMRLLSLSGEGTNPQNATAQVAANVVPEEQVDVPGRSVHVPNIDVDRMSEDGYPLVVDLGTSERQSRLARQRLIEQVIQEQGQSFDPDVMEELERANTRRVFEEEANGPGCSTEQHRPANALSQDGMALTPRVEAAIANYMVRKYAADTVGPSDDIEGEPSRNNSSPPAGPSRERETDEDMPPVNILPASRSLDLPVSNLIAIGRRPIRTGRNRRTANATEATPLGWQASKTSLKERIGYMFCNDVLSDVYFIVGKEEARQRVPAHKFVLSIGSVVFDAMFNGGLTPNNSRDPLEIELPDVEPSAFLTLLKFLYSDEVNIGPESVMTTLYTAKKYAVPAMETACVEFLKQSLGADNAFMLLTQARLFDEPQLEQLCLEIIDKNTHEALSGEGFYEIDLTTLCLVLARDTLRVREGPLFMSVVGWASEECGRRGLEDSPESKRTVLGSALQLIRFPLMTVEEFAQTAAQSCLLTDREIVNLFLYFTVNPKPSTNFNDRPRCAIAGKELVVGRFQRNEVRWGYSGMPDRIKFTVDRRIYVIGFGLYGGIVGPHEYPCTIQIIHCGTGKVMANNETTYVCDGSSNTFRVLFRDPVEITPSVTYIASAHIKGPDTHYGTKGLRRIVHQSNMGGTVTFQFTYAAGNNNGTSVEDGQIPEIIFYTKLN